MGRHHNVTEIGQSVSSLKSVKQPDFSSEDFRVRATTLLAMVAVLLLGPFAASHVLQGKYVLFSFTALVMAILVYNVVLWRRGRAEDAINLFLLVPIVVACIGMAIVKEGHMVSVWCYPALMSFYCVLPIRKAFIANALMLVVVTAASVYAMPFEYYTRVIGALVASSVFAGIMISAIDRQYQILHDRIVTDHLTGVFNRSLLETSLDSAFRTHGNSGKPMTLLSLDIDHFKSINDTFGHADGDAVLRSIGELLLKKTRKSDFVFRPGGEEFLVLLTGSDRNNGWQVAETLRKGIEALNVLPDRTVTVSIGVAELEDEATWKLWCRRADENLYLAKDQGRNRVVVQ